MQPWSAVTRILTNPEGTRVTSVEYYDQKKERQVQPASVVVLAAWAAQNPRILLNSATDKHPNPTWTAGRDFAIENGRNAGG